MMKKKGGEQVKQQYNEEEEDSQEIKFDQYFKMDPKNEEYSIHDDEESGEDDLNLSKSAGVLSKKTTPG